MHRIVAILPRTEAARSHLEDLSLLACSAELAFVVTVLLVTALTGMHG
jgi:hypothetical protein